MYRIKIDNVNTCQVVYLLSFLTILLIINNLKYHFNFKYI